MDWWGQKEVSWHKLTSIWETSPKVVKTQLAFSIYLNTQWGSSRRTSHFDKWYWQNVNPSQYISISLGRVLPAISPLWWMTPAFCQQQKISLKWRPIYRQTERCLTACSERRLVHPCHWKSHRSILSTPYIPLSLCSPVLSVCLSVFSPYTHHIHHIFSPPYIHQNVVKQRLAENQLLPYDQTASGFPHFNVIKVSKHPAGRPQLPLHKKPIQ